ncbi:MAG TPA: sulfatase [Chitinophagaceae bacterium]|nr:sulfatase [Chitinophagaceae bacterium]
MIRSLLILLLFGSPVLAQQPPNIIYIMSDDHDADAISAYNKKLVSTPNIDRLAKEGMRFNRCFVGNSICTPARATLLTGQHSHKNGVKDNRNRFDSSRMTMPGLLQQAGYQTALFGKWHLHSYPTGFDKWLIYPGQGLYVDPRLIQMNGDTTTYRGYSTEVITKQAIGWIGQADKTKPFALLLHHKAPHRYFLPALKHLEAFRNKAFPEPPTLYIDTAGRGSAWRIQTMSILRDMQLCSDLKVDPKYLQNMPYLKPDSAEVAYYNAIMNRIPAAERTRVKEIYAERGALLQRDRPSGNALLKLKYQWFMQDYLACVASIDESVGQLLNYLDAQGLSGNTIVIYTSDQGFYLGENGWFDKRFMYDVSMQTPLLVRWPGKIKPNTVSNAMVQNIDFAPTILDAAGVAVPQWMQGKSMQGILTGRLKEFDRPYLYYHYYEFGRDHTVIPHLGVRTKRYKLIYFYTVNEWELYDLQKDPSELRNLARDPKHRATLQQMKDLLVKARNEYDDHEPAGTLH